MLKTLESDAGRIDVGSGKYQGRSQSAECGCDDGPACKTCTGVIVRLPKLRNRFVAGLKGLVGIQANVPEDCAECGSHWAFQRSCEELVINKSISFKGVMAYQFDPVIHRMVDKYGWEEQDARETFEDTKRYLYLCAAIGKPIAPSKKIDEVWHNFILHTEDYTEFCLAWFGRYIQHRPRRRGESFAGKMLDTTLVAQKVFGKVSKNWDPPKAGNDDCGTCMSCKDCNGGNCS